MQQTLITESFLVDKSDLFSSQFKSAKVDPLKEGELILQVEKYAFTTNNITYAISAPKLNYWDFFPTEEGMGIIPVWVLPKLFIHNMREYQKGNDSMDTSQ